MLPIMLTFVEPDTRIAPPPSPAEERLKVDLWNTRLELTLLSAPTYLFLTASRRVLQVLMQPECKRTQMRIRIHHWRQQCCR